MAPDSVSPGRVPIARIETLRLADQPNVLWVEVTDASGRTGLGETYYLPGAVEAVIHEMAAPLLLGGDPLAIERHWQNLFACASFYGNGGAEMRAFSALDIALWDLLGHRTGLSIGTLLGGRVRDDVRCYATCVDAGPYRDAEGFLERPGELAEDLLGSGIRGMKVWPWDRFAPQLDVLAATGPAGWSAMGPVGHDLSPDDLDAGLDCVRQIRERVGSRMDVIIEGHGRWDLNAAIRICRALEPYDVAWAEDLVQADSADDLARLVRETRVPQAVSERLITRFPYRRVLEAAAAHIVMVDVVWCGGLTEARRIAALADLHHLPVTTHDCVGPVALAAGLQLCAHAPNALAQETVRGFVEGWYREVIEEPIDVVAGRAAIADRPGHGAALRHGVRQRAGVSVRTTDA